MKSTRLAQSASSAEDDPGSHAPISSRDHKREIDGWFAGPVIAIGAVVCCAGPLLLGVVAASGAGAWLAAHGYAISAAALLVVAAALAWRIRVRVSRG